MNATARPTLTALAAAVAAALALPLAAFADGGAASRPTNPAWIEECGSCHVAYPPRLLPAESWRRMMAGLPEHFGTDASTTPELAAEIEAFLVANARRPKAGAPPVDPAAAPLRITETRWFRAEHDEVRAAKWKSPEVGSPANCGACHRGADRGSYRESEIRIP